MRPCYLIFEPGVSLADMHLGAAVLGHGGILVGLSESLSLHMIGRHTVGNEICPDFLSTFLAEPLIVCGSSALVGIRHHSDIGTCLGSAFGHTVQRLVLGDVRTIEREEIDDILGSGSDISGDSLCGSS